MVRTLLSPYVLVIMNFQIKCIHIYQIIKHAADDDGQGYLQLTVAGSEDLWNNHVTPKSARVWNELWATRLVFI
jgi:hypothetical protein